MKLLLLFMISYISLSSIAQNIIAEYEFEGNTSDISGNQIDLLPYGTGTYYEIDSPGRTGVSSDSCIHFMDGIGLISTLPINNFNWGGTAVSFWVRDISNTDLGYVIQSSTGFAISVTASGDILAFFDGSSSGGLTVSSSINDGNWHHIVCQSDGSTTSIYIDGNYVDSQTETMFVTATDGNYYVGTTNLDNRRSHAFIDNLIIYDDALTEGQIDDLFNEFVGLQQSDDVKLNLHAYPNPLTDELHLEVDAPLTKVELLSISGQRVWESREVQAKTIDVSFLDVGCYLLRVYFMGNIHTQRVVKK